jgi:hypothetical protein
MATYEPPTADLPEFDTLVFSSLEESLTIAEADTRYLRFPLAQGDETIPNLTVGGVSTLGTATFTNNNPAYEIKYPVNSGQIDFYSNTGGGVSTRGCKIDATGVYTVSKFDTINETTGTLEIGNDSNRSGPINIGTGTGAAKNITIGTGSGGTTLMRGGTVNITCGSSGNNNIFTTSTGGSLTILPSDGTISSTALNIATGSSYTGNINIGTGAGSKSINIGSLGAGTSQINGSFVNLRTSNGGTVNIIDNISSGTVNIGTATTTTVAVNIATGSAYTGTINIGNGAGSKTITIGGSAGTTTISGANALLRPSGSGLAGVGDNMGSGEIRLGRADASATSTAINIGVGSASTSLISIGRGSPIAIQNGATSTITAAVPIRVSYSGTDPTTAGTTAIGYTASAQDTTFTSGAVISNIMSISITSGVWLVEATFAFSGATGGGRRINLNTVSGVASDERCMGIPTGTFGALAVSTVFAVSATTTIYLNIDCTAALGAAPLNISTMRSTRIA